MALVTRLDWAGMQRGWDAQQASYLIGRADRFALLAALVREIGGAEPTVLDLGCGTGSLAAAVLDAVGGARIIGVDADPALLRIADETLGRDDRVTLVRADLRDPSWVETLPRAELDAVVSSTALHWLPLPRVSTLYGELASLLLPGGLFADADHTPLAVPRLTAAASSLRREHEAAARTAGAVDWPGWWDELAASGAVDDELGERARVFDGEQHPDEQAPDAAWRLDALRAAGFSEAAVVWRHLQDAITAAVR